MPETMQAVAVTGLGQADVISMEKPTPRRGEIQVRVRACALCTWEQRVFTGAKQAPFPLVGGHEVAGEISALGEEVDPALYPLGAPVAVRVIKACGSCAFCRRGLTNLCPEVNSFRLNGPDVYGMGGLAEYLCVDRSAVWLYGQNAPSFPVMALTEPVACVMHSLEVGRPLPGDDVVVIGGGVMGLLHILCARLCGARTILSEPDPDRRAFALGLGCHLAVDPAVGDPVAAVMDITGGRGAQVVFNTTAVPGVTAQAIDMTAPAGRCVVYSSQYPDTPVPVSPGAFHSRETVLTGAANPSIGSFETAVNLISKGLLDPAGLITETLPYTAAARAFQLAARPDTYRVVVTF